MKQNPWAGLASYQDPAGGSTLLFCGRDNESYDLAALVDDNIFCTLYGKSGTGKTSLLNAGVFPRLREMGYLPLSIRLGMEAMDSTFQQCIAARLGKAATFQTADTVPLPADDQDEQWMWAWFARTRFVDGDGKVLFPVLVFDQFEEVFRGRRAEAETLLRQIHFMMDPSHTLGDDYDYNFRFLASIREDDLYLLEDSLDRNFMGDMKQCRYRLNALTDEGAREVILKPGKGLFSESEQDAIVDTVIGIARSADGSINTNILSLVCSRIYDHYQRSGDESISLDLVKRFVSSNPFEQFYNEVTENLGEKEKQFIEDRLVDAAGRRGSVSEPDFEKNVPNGAHLLEGTGRILQRVASGTEGRSYRIELIHDSFCAPLADQKLKRAARRRRRITIAVSILALIVATVAAYIIVMSIRNARQTREILIQQEKFYAKQASQLLDEGDTYTALLLLNELTDPDGPFAKIPLQPEAECQMRRAVMMNDTSEWCVVNSWKFEDYIVDVKITPDEKYLIYSTIGYVKVVESESGHLFREFVVPSVNMAAPQIVISHNSKLVAVQVLDECNPCSDLFVLNIETGEIKTIPLLNHSNHDYGGRAGGLAFNQGSIMFFSPDDKNIIQVVDTIKLMPSSSYKVRAFDITTGMASYDFDMGGSLIPIVVENGNEDGKNVAIMRTDGSIAINDKTTGRLLYQFQLRDCNVWKYVNDEVMVTVGVDAVYKYNILKEKWEKVVDRGFDMKLLGDVQSSNMEFLMSNEDTVFLYNIPNYEMKSFYKVNTLKHKVVLNKHKEGNIFIISPDDGKILSLEHHQKKRVDNEICLQPFSTAFIGDSLLLQILGYSQIELRRIMDNKVLFCDSVDGRLTLDDISPNGRYALYTLINYQYDEYGERISHEEDPSSGLIWKLVDLKSGTITSIGDTVEYWRYPFFIDDNNFVYYDGYWYDELIKYDIVSGDTSLYMKSVQVMYPKSRTKEGILLCGQPWCIFNPRKKQITELEGFSGNSAKFTSDGKYILATLTNGVVALYQVSDMTLLEKRKGRPSRICAISPDNRYAVLISEIRERIIPIENTTNRFVASLPRLELWSLFPLYFIGELDADYYWNGDMIFDSHGRNIMYYSSSATQDGSIDLFKIPVPSQQEIIEKARTITGGRKLTDEEKNLLME